MRSDLYTKIVLTLIAVLLACNLFTNLHLPAVQAQNIYRIEKADVLSNTKQLRNKGDVVAACGSESSCFVILR
jgi:hypothetical protein